MTMPTRLVSATGPTCLTLIWYHRSMQAALPYLLMPVMAGLLVLGQALWGTVIKGGHVLEGSPATVFMNLVTSPRMWLGAGVYILATLLYFFMLSKLKFFSVQIAMTGLS